jgi:hypothetical protein
MTGTSRPRRGQDSSLTQQEDRMGDRDSSATRVVPVFDRLLAADPTGAAWLARLLRLPVGGHCTAGGDAPVSEIRAHGWGTTEVRLAPPVALLSWLIRHPRRPNSGQLSGDPLKAEIRTQWIAGSNDRIAEGLRLLTHNPGGQDWHIFEGPTQPDAFIETDHLVVVIEGKRTERAPTTTTKWMAGRHQMLRHLDGAWEARGCRRVIGFFIVEGSDDSLEPPAEWLRFSSETTNAGSLASSLPHRGPEEQHQIAEAFAGVTTWQRVCQEFQDLGLGWATLPDKVAP